jgi:hypothetical protein
MITIGQVVAIDIHVIELVVETNRLAAQLGDGRWRSIAEQVSKETDPAKLMILVAKLCCALEVERRQNSQPKSVILRERA